VQRDAVPPALAAILAAFARTEPGAITRGQRLEADLGLDSLSMIDVACAAEDAFGIRIPDEDLERFATVGDAVDCIERTKSTG
jgi:acyl carrier protein